MEVQRLELVDSAEKISFVKPSFLILGGTGFIGRNLVHYLVSNNLSDEITVVDRVPPLLAWLNKTHAESFSRISFKQINLINSTSVDELFKEVGQVDYVVNLAAETKYGQISALYEEGIFKLSVNCAKAASRHCVKRYIELSSGQIHSSEKHAITESVNPTPWTHIAQFKVEVEAAIHSLADLNYIIIRPAIVYGIGDRIGLTPRLVIGAVYKYINEKMSVLWTKNLHMNTVHVHDVCGAIYHLCRNGENRETYHVVDKNCTTQGDINDLISQIFQIRHGYAGSVASNLARLNMENVVDDLNNKHMSPWATMCRTSGIENTPLNPYLDQELLYNKHTNMDGSKIEKTGFVYKHPKLTKKALEEVLSDYIEQKIFPKLV